MVLRTLRGYHNGRRLALLYKEGHFSLRKGGVPMVTYEMLFLFGSLVLAIIALVIDITKRK